MRTPRGPGGRLSPRAKGGPRREPQGNALADQRLGASALQGHPTPSKGALGSRCRGGLQAPVRRGPVSPSPDDTQLVRGPLAAEAPLTPPPRGGQAAPAPSEPSGAPSPHRRSRCTRCALGGRPGRRGRGGGPDAAAGLRAGSGRVVGAGPRPRPRRLFLRPLSRPSSRAEGCVSIATRGQAGRAPLLGGPGAAHRQREDTAGGGGPVGVGAEPRRAGRGGGDGANPARERGRPRALRRDPSGVCFQTLRCPALFSALRSHSLLAELNSS